MNAPRPQKRLPDEIYMRRRVAAVVILVVVIGLLVWIISALAGGDDNSAEPDNAADTTTSSSSTSEDTSSETSESETEEASTSAETSAKEEPKPSCSLEDLQIEAKLNHAEFAPGQTPVFYMVVHNPTEADCTIDLSKEELRYEVYDLETNQRVWADTDCNPPEDDSEKVFEAGSDTKYQAQWSVTTSQPGQCENRQKAPKGAYFLHTVIGDNASEAITFNLI
ncbi:hypothetical protein [Corynebacterium ciconiae]|uniref:hypothetical protein n=1 Tax=Corynebacterium ciconiae TaxID=227319 RepID=UPI0004763CCB|nr:hypothetical protein [Corynebacterium ciconiae]